MAAGRAARASNKGGSFIFHALHGRELWHPASGDVAGAFGFGGAFPSWGAGKRFLAGYPAAVYRGLESYFSHGGVGGDCIRLGGGSAPTHFVEGALLGARGG